jgi:CRISPR system Cascade subunit CasB
MKSEPQPFIEYLERIRDGNDQSRARAILATLRRGLGKEPGEDANVMRYVVPYLPAEGQPWKERPYFLIASLFALHPEPGGSGNMGKHFAAIRQGNPNEEAIERRFTVLLNTHEDDLDGQLRQAVSLCKAHSVPIDWHQLLRDVQGWGHPNRRVQRTWARSFWERTQAAQQPDSEPN